LIILELTKMTFLVYGDSLTTGSLFIGLYPGFRSFASITTWELASSHQMIVYISPGNKKEKKAIVAATGASTKQAKNIETLESKIPSHQQQEREHINADTRK